MIRLSSLTIGILLVMIMALAALASGSFTVNAVKETGFGSDQWHWTATVDSIDTLSSYSFQLNDYLDAYWGSPMDTVTVVDTSANWTMPKSHFMGLIPKPFRYQLNCASVGGSVKLTIYIDGSLDGTNWHRVDTLATNYATETPSTGTVNLNNGKFHYYRIYILGVATNGSDTTFDLRLFGWQRKL